MGLELEGTAAVAKGLTRRDTPPGMCTSQTMEAALHHTMKEHNPVGPNIISAARLHTEYLDSPGPDLGPSGMLL